MDTDKHSFLNLPNELLLAIFRHLNDLETRKQLSLTCFRFNELAFDSRYLGRVSMTLMMNQELNITRFYRAFSLRLDYSNSLDDDTLIATLENIARKSAGHAVEDLDFDIFIESSMAARFLSVFPNVKRLCLYPTYNEFPDDLLPSLEQLEELVIVGEPSINLRRLAPNLRSLEVFSCVPGLVAMIQHLPLKQLKLFVLQTPLKNHCNIFYELSIVTSLTHVIVFNEDEENEENQRYDFNQANLEKLCEYSPLLSELRFEARKITSLECMTDLQHLKILRLTYCDQRLINPNGYSLQILELDLHSEQKLHFYRSIRYMFPNLIHLKLRSPTGFTFTNRIINSFPRLVTLSITFQSPNGLELSSHLLEGLSELNELFVSGITLINNFPILRNLAKLTLVNSSIIVTEEITTSIPNFFDIIILRGEANCFMSD